MVLPAATGSIITGVMLAIARVAGETAPLLFTALGSQLLTATRTTRFPSLTVADLQQCDRPRTPKQRKLAWAGILVLILLIFVLNVLVRFFIRSLVEADSADAASRRRTEPVRRKHVTEVRMPQTQPQPDIWSRR